jgi:hypothetical protein
LAASLFVARCDALFDPVEEALYLGALTILAKTVENDPKL